MQFRKIFGKPGNEICLISLLNAILELPHPIQSIHFQNPFSLKEFEDDKLVCVDVKATDDMGRIFVVEIQMVVHSSFAKRALFYACNAYSDQLRRGQGYGELKATYCVSLLMRKLWDDEQLHHHFRFVERTTGSVMEESMEIHTVELSKYNGSIEDVGAASELERWCYWLKYADEHTKDELRAFLPGVAIERATSELQRIQEITEEKEMYDSREKAILDYESNLTDARAKGEAIGIEKGEAIGIEKGEAIGRIQLLQELLGESISRKEDLARNSREQLGSIMKELQSRLRLRDA